MYSYKHESRFSLLYPHNLCVRAFYQSSAVISMKHVVQLTAVDYVSTNLLHDHCEFESKVCSCGIMESDFHMHLFALHPQYSTYSD